MAILTMFVIPFNSFADDLFDKFNFGIEGACGINFSVSDPAEGKDLNGKRLFALRLGMGAELNLSDYIAAQVKAFVRYPGFSCKDKNKNFNAPAFAIDMPLLLKFTFANVPSEFGRFALFGGPNLSFTLSDSKDFSGEKLYAMGLEFGTEYSMAKVKGLRMGCSVLMDFLSFTNGISCSVNRISIMPYIACWL